MHLSRLYAYEVYPQKNKSQVVTPDGGSISVNAELRHTLTRLVRDNRLETQTPIAFHVSNPGQSSASNSTRDALMGFAFGGGPTTKRNADYLALKLSSMMDERSNPFLFLLTGFSVSSGTRVVLWAFPKDEGLRFSHTKSGVRIDVINDIFNISSALRKAALFDGTNSRLSFWEGRMVDFQSGRTQLWVEDFLECRLSVSGIYGTNQLAEFVAAAYKKTADSAAREQLFNAIVAVRTAPVRRMSHLRFANDYLQDSAKAIFLAGIPADQHNVSFDFDRATFEQKLGFRAFKMKDDVFLTAPFETIDVSVKVNAEQLSYAGEISTEYLRATGGGR